MAVPSGERQRQEALLLLAQQREPASHIASAVHRMCKELAGQHTVGEKSRAAVERVVWECVWPPSSRGDLWMIHKVRRQKVAFPYGFGENAGLRRLILGAWNTDSSKYAVHVGSVIAPPERHDAYIVPTENHAWVNTLLYLDADARFLILSRPWNCTDVVGAKSSRASRHMVCVRRDRAGAPLAPAMHRPPPDMAYGMAQALP